MTRTASDTALATPAPATPALATPAAGTPRPAPPLRRVTALLHPGYSVFEFGIACEVFGLDRTHDGLPAFELTVCAPEPGVLPGRHGTDLVIRHGLEALDDADLVIVVPCGLDTELGPTTTAALHRVVARGGRIASFCSGSFLLARAGLLDGRRATTHWRNEAEFRRRFPAIELVPDVLYVEDGPILTSAGTAAGVDLCLHLVRQAHGRSAATGIARRMVMPPHRDAGQAQYVRTPVPACSDSSIADVIGWAAAHLDEDLSVERLAGQALLSERTFARRFRDATGTSPHQWVLAQRVSLAEELLERGVLTIDEVARRCGFGSATMLRHHFSRARCTTPTAFRRAFAGR